MTSIQGDFDDANALAIQPDGKIIVTGFTAGADNDLVIVRYLDDLGVGQVEANVSNTGLHAYPVPATDRIWINGLPVNASGSIVDQCGREVVTFSGMQRGVDVSALARGIYQVRIAEGGTMLSVAFIKD